MCNGNVYEITMDMGRSSNDCDKSFTECSYPGEPLIDESLSYFMTFCVAYGRITSHFAMNNYDGKKYIHSRLKISKDIKFIM